jgi:hypothetical protein
MASALRASQQAKGENSYYYAHKDTGTGGRSKAELEEILCELLSLQQACKTNYCR